MGNFPAGGWYDYNTMEWKGGRPTPFYFSRRMHWKPWRWEVYERRFNGLDFNLVVLKRNLTKVSARGFVKLLSGE